MRCAQRKDAPKPPGDVTPVAPCAAAQAYAESDKETEIATTTENGDEVTLSLAAQQALKDGKNDSA